MPAGIIRCGELLPTVQNKQYDGYIRNVLMCYEGSFTSMDGPVDVNGKHLQLLAKTYNERITKAKMKFGEQVPPQYYAPLQLDHGESATETVGRVIGPLVTSEFNTLDGRKVTALFGRVKVIGEENIKKAEDGRYASLSVGCDFESGHFKELTITPFPAAPEASLLRSSINITRLSAIHDKLTKGTQMPNSKDKILSKYFSKSYGLKNDACNAMLRSMSEDHKDEVFNKMPDEYKKMAAPADEESKTETMTKKEIMELMKSLMDEQHERLSKMLKPEEKELSEGEEKETKALSSEDKDEEHLSDEEKAEAKMEAEKQDLAHKKMSKDSEEKKLKGSDDYSIAEMKKLLANHYRDNRGRYGLTALELDMTLRELAREGDRDTIKRFEKIFSNFLSEGKDENEKKLSSDETTTGTDKVADINIPEPAKETQVGGIRGSSGDKEDKKLKKFSKDEDKDEKKLSEDEDKEKKNLKRASKDENEEDNDKKMGEDDAQEKKIKEIAGEVKKMSADLVISKLKGVDEETVTRLKNMTKAFSKASEEMLHDIKLQKINSKFARLRSQAKMTPAELKKVDVNRLAKKTDAELSEIFKAYDSREPVLNFRSIGSQDAVELSDIRKDMKRLRQENMYDEAISDMQFTSSALKRQGNAPERENVHVSAVEKTSLNKLSFQIGKMLSEGKTEDAKKMIDSAFEDIAYLSVSSKESDQANEKRVEALEDAVMRMSKQMSQFFETIKEKK